MVLKEQPFKSVRGKKTAFEKKQQIQTGNDVFSIRLNEERRNKLETAKRILCVDRDSTALLELADIGYNVIQDSKTGALIKTIVKRIRKGYVDTIADYNQENDNL